MVIIQQSKICDLLSKSEKNHLCNVNLCFHCRKSGNIIASCYNKSINYFAADITPAPTGPFNQLFCLPNVFSANFSPKY